MLDLDDPSAPAPSDPPSLPAVEGAPVAPEPDRPGAAGPPPRGRMDRVWLWFAELPPEAFVSLFVVSACVVFVWMQVTQATSLFSGGNILASNTPAGGDMGAHVWGPAYLRDHLLPQGRLAGWTPDWYAGFPAYQFYMVLPSLAIALLSFVMPYGVAFKLVTVSGVLSLPVCAWAFGKLSDTPFPGAPLYAVGATMFLFDRGFSIYGGNIPSTLAGEFAFSISLSFAVLYLGFLAKALRTGQGRGWAAVTLALVGLNHLIPFIFVIICTAVMLVAYPAWRARRWVLVALPSFAGVAALTLVASGPRRDFSQIKADDLNKPLAAAIGVVFLLGLLTSGWQRVKVWLPVGVVGTLLTAWWTVPFYLQHKYMNDMGWEKKTDYFNMLYSRTTLDPQLVDSPKLQWILLAAAAGALLALIWGRRSGAFLGLVAVVFAGLFILTPQLRLWNARLLPFYYLALYLLAALGVAEVGRLLSLLFARDVLRPIRAIPVVFAFVGLAVGLGMVAIPLRIMPFGQEDKVTNTYYWPSPNVPWVGGMVSTHDSSFVPSWSRWNYTGYEGKDAYPEYYGITQTMADLGRTRGCGRAMWEHEEQHDRFGTPMALMLLPFWTDGCIGSMEGLYFEASSTTPYHFLNQDELSTGPSNAQRDLPYGPGPPTATDFDMGIKHLQMLGVKYYMAISDGMHDLARQNPDLTKVATFASWEVYEISRGNELVEPLRYQPAVLSGAAPGGEAWLKPSVAWYMNEKAWDVPLTDDGPAPWQRVTEGEGPGLVPLEPVTVSNVVVERDRIAFDVDRTGVPVVVKTSFFPNWKPTGAEGPWRVTPSNMVLVPTANHVELRYGYTKVDYLAWALSLIGVAGAVVLFRRPAVTMPPTWAERSAARRAEAMSLLAATGPGAGVLPHEDAVWLASLADRPPDGPGPPDLPTDGPPDSYWPPDAPADGPPEVPTDGTEGEEPS